MKCLLRLSLLLALVSSVAQARGDVLYTFDLVDSDGALDGSGSFLINNLPPTLMPGGFNYPQFTEYSISGGDGGNHYLEMLTIHIDGYTYTLDNASDLDSNVRFQNPDSPAVYYNSFVFQPIGGGYGYFLNSFYTNGGEFEFSTYMPNLSLSGNLAFNSYSIVPSATTPEPSTFALLGTGVLGIVGSLRRRS